MKTPQEMSFIVQVSADKDGQGPKEPIPVVSLDYAQNLYAALQMREAVTLAASHKYVETSASAPSLSESEERIQVTPDTFISIAKNDPHAIGVPIYWSEWPSQSAPHENKNA